MLLLSDNLLLLIQAANIRVPKPLYNVPHSVNLKSFVGQIMTFEINLFTLKDRYFVNVRK